MNTINSAERWPNIEEVSLHGHLFYVVFQVMYSFLNASIMFSFVGITLQDDNQS